MRTHSGWVFELTARSPEGEGWRKKEGAYCHSFVAPALSQPALTGSPGSQRSGFLWAETEGGTRRWEEGAGPSAADATARTKPGSGGGSRRWRGIEAAARGRSTERRSARGFSLPESLARLLHCVSTVFRKLRHGGDRAFVRFPRSAEQSCLSFSLRGEWGRVVAGCRGPKSQGA